MAVPNNNNPATALNSNARNAIWRCGGTVLVFWRPRRCLAPMTRRLPRLSARRPYRLLHDHRLPIAVLSTTTATHATLSGVAALPCPFFAYYDAPSAPNPSTTSNDYTTPPPTRSTHQPDLSLHSTIIFSLPTDAVAGSVPVWRADSLTVEVRRLAVPTCFHAFFLSFLALPTPLFHLLLSGSHLSTGGCKPAGVRKPFLAASARSIFFCIVRM
ncbi:hypothetical protein DL93DRAFT_1187379 [Clavulina sp. PMI_390]|nr:hypothetical protein DL93DRAFT_1187379 [Clavulina sp. PMI_390]